MEKLLLAAFTAIALASPAIAEDNNAMFTFLQFGSNKCLTAPTEKIDAGRLMVEYQSNLDPIAVANLYNTWAAASPQVVADWCTTTFIPKFQYARQFLPNINITDGPSGFYR